MVRTTSAAGTAAVALFALFSTSYALAQQAAPSDADLRQAAYLAANCANCHGTNGVSVTALPGLAGLPKPVLVEQMKAFRDGKRNATIMHQLAKGYSDQQIELMAEHFSRQRPVRK